MEEGGVTELQMLESEVEVMKSVLEGVKKADTKSIMSVLALGAASGAEATIEAEGPQAEEAMAAAAAILTTEEG